MKRFDVIRNKKMIRKHSIPFGGVVVYGTTQNIVLHISEKVDNLITNQEIQILYNSTFFIPITVCLRGLAENKLESFFSSVELLVLAQDVKELQEEYI